MPNNTRVIASRSGDGSGDGYGYGSGEMSENEFRPNWASPPGDTILDLLDDKNIAPSELATYLQISFRETRDLLNGTFKITDEIAEKLAEFLGGSKQFWVNRETQYRETLERLNNETLCKK